MAQGKKTGGKNFKPGESGNPNGRPPVPDDLREARTVNQHEFERVANLYLFMKRPELMKAAEQADLPMLDTMVVALMVAIVNTGDYKRLNFLLERTIGKVKTVVEISGPNGAPIETRVGAYSDEELARRYNELIVKATQKKK